MNNLIKELTQFYSCLNHQQVIDLIDSKIDTQRFEILEAKYYKAWIPKNLNHPVPLLAAHSDTVFLKVPQNIANKNGKIWCKDKSIGLGADDRNGCYLLSQMMMQRPDDFIFALFDLEEHGCIGSMSFDILSLKEKISVIIGLDRKGRNEIALYGFENDELITALKSINGYDLCNGTMTDCAILAELSDICCFNLSVGYYRNHQSGEYTIINHLKQTEDLLLNLPASLWDKQYIVDEFLFDDDFYDLPMEYNWSWPSQKENKRRW